MPNSKSQLPEAKKIYRKTLLSIFDSNEDKWLLTSFLIDKMKRELPKSFAKLKPTTQSRRIRESVAALIEKGYQIYEDVAGFIYKPSKKAVIKSADKRLLHRALALLRKYSALQKGRRIAGMDSLFTETETHYKISK